MTVSPSGRAVNTVYRDRKIGKFSSMNEGKDLKEGVKEGKDRIGKIGKTKKPFKKTKDPCPSAKNANELRLGGNTNSSNNSDQFNDYVGTFLKDALDGRPGVTAIESLQNAYRIDSTANVTLNTR